MDPDSVSGQQPAAASTLNLVDTYVPLTLGENYVWSLHRVIDRGPLFLIAGAAALDHSQNNPTRWGQGSEGYAARVASRFGRASVREGVALGIRALDHEDPRYFRSHSKGAWKRTRYALSRSVVARGESGGDMPAYSRLVADFSTPFIADLWRPERIGMGREFRAGGMGLGLTAAGNLCQEFWPDVRKKLHR